jgi:NodT family efflux transporter outer membrane factor (OMF) lipoprotein
MKQHPLVSELKWLHSPAAWLMPVLLSLVACQSPPVQPRGDVHAPVMPSNFRNGLPDPEPGSVEAIQQLPWWQRFGSRELDTLVTRALSNNSDIKIASLRVSQARIRSDQARAGALPIVTAPLRAVVQSGAVTSDAQQSSQVAVQANWRLDVWGEQRGVTESAELQVARATHERENVQRIVTSAVVSTYISYLANNDAIDLARKNEAVALDILRTLEMRATMGDVTANELEQQRSLLSIQQGVMPALENQKEDLRSQLARLLGELASGVELSDRGVDALRVPSVEPGLPSSLLLRRPDIRMMEARMRSANADIDVARARLLPTIDLNVQAGVSGLSVLQLFNPQNFLVNALASMTATIFDGGRREANRAMAESYHEEMVETYAQTVYQGVREVESALSAIRASQLQLQAYQRSSRSMLNVFGIASEAYAVGAVDLSTLLESRKNYQNSLDEVRRIKEGLLRSCVNLYSALGDAGSS